MTVARGGSDGVVRLRRERGLPCELTAVVVFNLVFRVTKSGSRLGFTTVDLFRKSDGKLIATGRHTKAL